MSTELLASLDPLAADTGPTVASSGDSFRCDARLAAGRTVRGCTLLVCRTAGHLHRLNRVGSEIWQVLAAAPAALDSRAILASITDAVILDPTDIEAFLIDLEHTGLIVRVKRSPSLSHAGRRSTTVHSARDAPGPRRRRIANTWELVDEIEPTSSVRIRAVGTGFVLCTSDDTLSVLAAEAALVWDLLRGAPATFVEILDALCDRFGTSYQDAERVLVPLLQSLHCRGAIRGVEHLTGLRASAQGLDGTNASRRVNPSVAGPRALGRLERMRPDVGDSIRPFRLLSSGPVVRDLTVPITRAPHVAIVCQYGIHGLVPGTGSYVQRCIARLRRLDVDVIVLAGGGRHGSADVREAESVVDLYRAHLPEVPLWVETHSSTTWENLQYSLELLLVRSIIPARVSLLGDRARAEKLRVCCWLARRRFPPLRHVSFRVMPTPRQPMTWRDRRAIQMLVGPIQVLRESWRTQRPALLSGLSHTR
jgi:hypothetical protein